MKSKKITAVIAAVCMAGALCSCFKSEPVQQSSSEYSRISISALDENLLGEWYNGANGYIFGENRKLSLVLDFSERGHFTEKGEFQTVNGTIPPEWITVEGDEVRVVKCVTELETQDVTEIPVLEMTRKSSTGSGFNGEYTLKQGAIPNVIANDIGIDPEGLEFEVKVEGETFVVTIVNCFDYEIMGDSVIDIFSPNVTYVDENARGLSYKYTIDGDTLTMNYTAIPDAPAEVYTRVK